MTIALEAQSALEITLDISQTLNFALEQSGVPFVRGGRVLIRGVEPLRAPFLELELLPGLGEPMRFHLPELLPGEPFQLPALDYRLPAGRLRQVVEAERAQLEWRFGDGEEILAVGRCEVDVLAYNEWPAGRGHAGLLASFVLPNHPAIVPILQRTRTILGELTGSNALDGYQAHEPGRVAAMVSALYVAVQSFELSYAEVPASFEASGQKVRLPDALMQDRVGCCLDIALLVAACLEQMGLHPLVAIVKGHAFQGVWLVDDRFPEGIVEDAARIRNAMQAGQLLMFDSSTIVLAGRPPLEVARSQAERCLMQDDDFRHVLDVRALRRERFRPLPLRRESTEEEPEAAADAPVEPEACAAEPPPIETPSATLEVRSRFARWQEKLLDLSLRNRLLNFPADTKAGLRLLVPDVAGLEDYLCAGHPVEVLPAPPLRQEDLRDANLAERRMAPEEFAALLAADQKRGIVYTPLGEPELLKRWRTLERTARTDFEEGGVQTLYLAVGILKWFEGAQSRRELQAPLLLYPAALEFDRTRQRFRLRLTPDDPIANVTLVEKLRREQSLDLGALLALDADESGLDVPKLLQGVRLAIQRMPRWEVLEEVRVGLFSFKKFLMWRDLGENADRLLESDVVRHLAAREDVAFRQAAEEIKPEQLDLIEPVACVVDADSTQTAAVASALAGRSFVLQGPPGTGKSQTIANLIAALLAAGKRVLFVAEKQVALEVVHRRLQSVGLGDFCLELHGRDADKQKVIDAFTAVLERARQRAGVPWDQHNQELSRMRSALNALATALHRPRSLGRSFHQVVDRLRALSDAPQLSFVITMPEKLDAPRFQSLLGLAEAFSGRAAAVEPIEGHPLASIGPAAWTIRMEEDLVAALAQARGAAAVAQAAEAALTGILAQPEGFAPQALESLCGLAAILSAGPLPARLGDPAWPESLRRIEALWSAEQRQADAGQSLAQRWRLELLTMDVAGLHARFSQAQGSPLAFLSLFGARRMLKAHAVDALPDNLTITTDLGAMRDLGIEARRLEDERTWLRMTFGAVDREALDRLARAEDVAAQLARWGIAPANLPAEFERARLGQAGERLLAALVALRASSDALARIVPLAAGTLPAWDQPGYATHLDTLLANWQSAVPRLKAWCQYRISCDEVGREGLSELAEAHAGGRIAAADFVPALERHLLTRWAIAVRDADPALAAFDGSEHETLVARFARLDKEMLKLARAWVAATLESRLPDPGAPVADSSELGILKRQKAIKRGKMSVRRLLQAIPNLAFRLKPCFMMSPLSIAQFLPADGPRFDVVIFDEASQMGTHDAIGAIARGKQVIIVGDSKQMPPTTFFQRQNDEGPPDDNDVIELESILDEALAKQLPQQMLGWHYRSLHDSLIDFSNRHYYEGKLQVFPAAAQYSETLGLKWHPVPDGVYYGGKGENARTNPLEAEALVSHLVETLRRVPPGTRTFGVVTFSQTQRELIMDLLDDRRARHPEIEAHFTGGEPVFVKNLENVQGDERDEIYFSIGYAKDESGKLRMLFGPLSASGGERRLNVAVTRARCQLRVFSTLSWDQIDLDRTSAVGTAHLRDFLKLVAERDASQEAVENDRVPPTALESALKRRLEEEGWEIHAQVGCGSYRVDLAVMHPHKPGTFLLGIETDGPHYAAGKTARDRERLRAQMLRALGWRLVRVWSVDAWRALDAQMVRLRVALQEALEAPEDTPEPVCVPPEPDEERLAMIPVAPVASSRFEARPYVPGRLAMLGDAEAFFAPRATETVRAAALSIVDTEGPVHLDPLCRSLAAAFGLQRVTERVRGRVLAEMRHLEGAGRLTLQGQFAWPDGLAPEALSYFRTAGEATRDAEYLPPEEVAIAASRVLSSNLSLPYDAAVREVARLFGIARLGKNVAAVIDEGLCCLIRQGKCVREGDTLRWLE